MENADGILLNYEEKKSWIETKPNLQEYLVNKMVRKKDKGHLDSLGLLYFEISRNDFLGTTFLFLQYSSSYQVVESSTIKGTVQWAGWLSQ